MAVTRLERKGLRNKARAKAKQKRIKELTKQPPIKNVDIEAIKEEFAKKSGKPVAKKESKKEKTVEEKPEVAEQEQPKAESASSGKKADVPQADEPQAEKPKAEMKEPAKAPREDAEAVEDKVEGEDKDSDEKS